MPVRKGRKRTKVEVSARVESGQIQPERKSMIPARKRPNDQEETSLDSDEGNEEPDEVEDDSRDADVRLAVPPSVGPSSSGSHMIPKENVRAEGEVEGQVDRDGEEDYEITAQEALKWLKNRDVCSMRCREDFTSEDGSSKAWCPLCISPPANVSSHLRVHFKIPPHLDKSAVHSKIAKIISRWKKLYFPANQHSFMTRNELFSLCHGSTLEHAQALRTTRKVARGEELIWSYGKDYAKVYEEPTIICPCRQCDGICHCSKCNGNFFHEFPSVEATTLVLMESYMAARHEPGDPVLLQCVKGAKFDRICKAILPNSLRAGRIAPNIDQLQESIEKLSGLICNTELDPLIQRQAIKEVVTQAGGTGGGSCLPGEFWRSVMRSTGRFTEETLFRRDILQGVRELLSSTENPLLLVEATGPVDMDHISILQAKWNKGRKVDRDAEALPLIAKLLLSIDEGPMTGYVAVRHLSRTNYDALVKVVHSEF